MATSRMYRLMARTPRGLKLRVRRRNSRHDEDEPQIGARLASSLSRSSEPVFGLRPTRPTVIRLSEGAQQIRHEVVCR